MVERTERRTANEAQKRIQGKPYEGESDLWTSDNLRGLFRNPTYTGATANGSRQIIAENCHEPYMTKEQFYALPCNMQQSENKISTRKNIKNRILLQSASFVPVDVHFIGIRIRKREKNYSIAATAVLTRRMERN